MKKSINTEEMLSYIKGEFTKALKCYESGVQWKTHAKKRCLWI